MPPIVPPEGPKECKLAFIGEAPGADEEIEGRPFCGMAGDTLNQKLHLVSIARRECYLTNIFKIRPYHFWDELGRKGKDKNDFSVFWRGEIPCAQLVNARDELLRELEDIKCNVFVALGANALWALTGERKIGKWRGSILETTLPSGRKVKVIGTYHPSAVNHQWTLGATMAFDLTKADAQSKFPELILPERNLMIGPTAGDVVNYIDKTDWSQGVSFDIETSPFNIECVAIAPSPHEALCIPTTPNYWGGYQHLKNILEGLSHVLTTKGYPKIGQNVSFDIQYLTRFFAIMPGPPSDWFDTMLAQHSCYSELLKGLDYLCSIYTNERYYKDDLKIWRARDMTDMELLWTYNCKDAVVTFECKYELEKEMEDLGTRATYDYMMELLEPLVCNMLRGARVDPVVIAQHRKEYQERLDEREARFEKQFPGVNPHSPKQVMDLAYKTLKIKPLTKKGKPTADKKAIEKLGIVNPHLKEVVGIRHDAYVLSHYINVPLQDAIDGRMRCSINPAGAETGRLSSSKGIFNSGTNLYNWPKKVRNIIVPEEGMVFTEADLKGAEAMIVAYLSEDPMLIKLFEEGKNIHTYTATNILWTDKTEADIKADKVLCEDENRDTESLYHKAKKTRHSGNYKGTWVTLSQELKVPAAEAKIYLRRFNELSPNLGRWHYETEQKIKRDRTLITPLGRKRIFFGRWGNDLFREAIAYVPQETVAHILNLGWIKVYKELCSHPKVNVINQVYDSILLEHPPEMTQEIHERLPKLMRVDLKIKGREFFIPVELKTGPNWRDMEERNG